MLSSEGEREKQNDKKRFEFHKITFQFSGKHASARVCFQFAFEVGKEGNI